MQSQKSAAVEMIHNEDHARERRRKIPLCQKESGISLMAESPCSASSLESRRESVDSVASQEDEGVHDVATPPVYRQGHAHDDDVFSLQELNDEEKENLQPREDASTPNQKWNNDDDVNKNKNKKKKKKRLTESLSSTSFKDVDYLTGDVLGEGSYGRVETCINMYTDVEYAVKIISTKNWVFSRAKVLKEVELYYLCQGQSTIIQLVEFFEEPDHFYLIFEKANGGQLLDQIQRRVHFTEEEASSIIRDLALALRFLHEKGIAHRDLKPENVLCSNAHSPLPVKLCDFDLCSGVHQTLSTPLLQSPVGSAEYMAPEVVNAFSHDRDEYFPYDDDDDEELTYDKRCDLWSLGVIAYILLCGYLPFSAGKCDNSDCGWERGDEECPRCTRSLFDAIRGDNLVFHDLYWDSISSEAKDLISKLLVKEASGRIDADAVLRHPFIRNGGSSTATLETPSVLRRQTTSVKEFSEFATNALAIQRNFFDFSFSRAFRHDGPNAGSAMKKSATSHNLADAEGRKSAQNSIYCNSNNSNSNNVRRMKRQTSMIHFPEEHAAFLLNRC